MLEQEIKNSLEAALAEFDIVKKNQEMKQDLHDKGIYTRTQLLDSKLRLANLRANYPILETPLLTYRHRPTK